MSMNFLQGLVIVSVLWGYNGVYGIDCKNATQELQECFPKSINVSQFSTSGISIFIQICNTTGLDAFKAGVLCAANISRQCPQEVGFTSQEYAVDVDTLVRGLDYMCEHIHDIDLTCWNRSLPEVTRCMIRKVLEPQDITWSRRSQTCKIIQITEQCFDEVLDSCSGKTKDVIMHYLRNYSVPAACLGSTIGAVPPTSPNSPNGVLWNNDGADCENATEELLECFSKSIDFSQFSTAVMPSIVKICNSEYINAFKTGYRCGSNITRRCPRQFGLPSQDYTVDADTALKGLDYVCQHVQDIDFICLNQSVPEVARCTVRKAMEHHANTKSRAPHPCMSIQMAEQCFDEVLTNCSGKTKDIVMHYIQNYSVPPTCRGLNGSISTSPTSSNVNGSISTSPTSSNGVNTVSPLLLLLVFLLNCFHWACAELQTHLTA